MSRRAPGPGPGPGRRRRGFARRGALHRGAGHFGPDMTSMVDVVMVLLIFFMASAAFLGEEWFLSAAIPVEAGAGTGTSDEQAWELPSLRIDIALDVDDQGRTIAASAALRVDREPVERVIERLGALPDDQQSGTIEVLIRPAARVPYRDIIRVHESCAAVGIAKIAIAVAPS